MANDAPQPLNGTAIQPTPLPVHKNSGLMNILLMATYVFLFLFLVVSMVLFVCAMVGMFTNSFPMTLFIGLLIVCLLGGVFVFASSRRVGKKTEEEG